MRGSSTQIGERTLCSYEYSFLSVSRVQSADGLTEMQASVKLQLRLVAPLLLDIAAPDPAKNARAEMLTALNKGEGVTAGLGWAR